VLHDVIHVTYASYLLLLHMLLWSKFPLLIFIEDMMMMCNIVVSTYRLCLDLLLLHCSLTLKMAAHMGVLNVIMMCCILV
jgi:hypothetical protein